MSQNDITALFDQWNAAIQTGDPKTVAALEGFKRHHIVSTCGFIFGGTGALSKGFWILNNV